PRLAHRELHRIVEIALARRAAREVLEERRATGLVELAVEVRAGLAMRITHGTRRPSRARARAGAAAPAAAACRPCPPGCAAARRSRCTTASAPHGTHRSRVDRAAARRAWPARPRSTLAATPDSTAAAPLPCARRRTIASR